MDSLESSSVTCNDSSTKLSDIEQEKTPQANDNSNAKDVEMVPPDGGWGWMVVAGSFLIMSVGGYIFYAFSIFLSPILMSDQVSSIKIAWIFNLYHLIWSFYTIFIGPLCEQFGTRKMAIFGGVASFLSLFLSAFAPTVDYLFFTFTLPAGIGGASAFTLTFIVVSTYFKKHRGFAIAMTSMGYCLSGFISPVIANYLLENYGYVSATAISGAFLLNQCVGASLYQPVKWHMKPSKKITVVKKESQDLVKWKKESEETDLIEKVHDISCKKPQTSNTQHENKNVAGKMLRDQKSTNKFMKVLQSTFTNLKSLKYMRVHLIAWSYFAVMFGVSNFFMWIPFVITNNGYSLEMATWCTSLSSIGNLIGRILMSLLADRKFFNVIYGFMFGQFLMGISIIGSLVVTKTVNQNG
ncbi:Monocarboxylate transporter 14 [Armadillidium nasatum]|uniref:Monocarboxylate transporter 14 n=1 Tax=Armadillidium nasatum TaxID=96803 RepID=A0A5N5TG37_9CRUS|nr:Monocarboxylate transporter 14 [Armadillidium nasatum]